LTSQSLRLREILARLVEAEIRFVLVGGLAVNAWGYLRATRDLDFVPDPSPENLARLNALLQELDGKVDVNGKLLEGSAISTFLRTGDRTLVSTELGQVHVLQGLPQIPPYAVLDEDATDVDLDGLVVRVCSLEHLLQMKRASDRDRDKGGLRSAGGCPGSSRGRGMTGSGATLSRLDLPGLVGISAPPMASRDGNHHFGTTDRAG
jgi:hypothetical protein